MLIAALLLVLGVGMTVLTIWMLVKGGDPVVAFYNQIAAFLTVIAAGVVVLLSR